MFGVGVKILFSLPLFVGCRSSVSTGCVFALDYLRERRKPTGSGVVGGSTVIPTRICPVDFVQRESQQGKL